MFSCLCFSSWDETARLICGGGGRGQFRTTCIGHLLSLVLGILRWLYRQRSGLGRSLKHSMICSRLGTHTQQRRTTGCSANSSGVCSPVGVRQLLEDAIPGSNFCIGLSNVILYVRHQSRVTPR